MDVAVNGTWLAYKWAKEDENHAAQEALERLIVNWPFDFYLFEAATDSADARHEDRIFDRPTARPTDRPHARPTDRPTDRPHARPTDRPTDR